ncbi:hypothetical protein CB1_000402009 [Camelus ferus]|nr:hypothetical protein CB1_000402009 [Camelus ferus]
MTSSLPHQDPSAQNGLFLGLKAFGSGSQANKARPPSSNSRKLKTRYLFRPPGGADRSGLERTARNPARPHAARLRSSPPHPTAANQKLCDCAALTAGTAGEESLPCPRTTEKAVTNPDSPLTCPPIIVLLSRRSLTLQPIRSAVCRLPVTWAKARPGFSWTQPPAEAEPGSC